MSLCLCRSLLCSRCCCTPSCTQTRQHHVMCNYSIYLKVTGGVHLTWQAGPSSSLHDPWNSLREETQMDASSLHITTPQIKETQPNVPRSTRAFLYWNLTTDMLMDSKTHDISLQQSIECLNDQMLLGLSRPLSVTTLDSCRLTKQYNTLLLYW